jgi:hypothetical protein
MLLCLVLHHDQLKHTAQHSMAQHNTASDSQAKHSMACPGAVDSHVQCNRLMIILEWQYKAMQQMPHSH